MLLARNKSNTTLKVVSCAQYGAPGILPLDYEGEEGSALSLALREDAGYLGARCDRLQAGRSYTVKRLRPFARRRARTARPALVDMRARKPWHFARLRVFG